MGDLEIIDPPQYSIAWIILAVLCTIVIIALIVTLLRLTRWLVERSAYRKRPGAIDVLKAEFLRSINAIGDEVAAGDMSPRDGHRELEAVLRVFVLRSEGLDIRHEPLEKVLADPRTASVGNLLARTHEAGYARESRTRLSETMHAARSVVRAWS
ncbi:hypothetical protein M3B90_02975 [Dermabacter sp. p3-SID358]|uniref:hypothetical protein n=1 Tax=Dermabacter sp. p3-SID358 TaxID=2916114 RepID=UPI0021A67CAD|nr:hypothetical protein [Dermabacter sp. p3-SID358]MCT1866491.1 hypothetical protein [Dermabacter sp. p3-SID358]